MIKSALLGGFLASACLLAQVSPGFSASPAGLSFSSGGSFDPARSISFYKAGCMQQSRSRRNLSDIIFNFADDTGIARITLETGQAEFYQYKGLPKTETDRRGNLTIKYAVSGRKGDGVISLAIPKNQTITVNEDNTRFYRKGEVIETIGRQTARYSCTFTSPVSKTIPNPPRLKDLADDDD